MNSNLPPSPTQAAVHNKLESYFSRPGFAGAFTQAGPGLHQHGRTSPPRSTSPPPPAHVLTHSPTPVTAASPTTSNHNNKFSLQKRRLQLRNAGFRTAASSDHHASSLSSSSYNGMSSLAEDLDDSAKENGGSTSNPGLHSISSESRCAHPANNILQQIEHNQSSQGRSTRISSFGALLESFDHKAPQRRVSPNSAFHHNSLNTRHLSPHASFKSLIPNTSQRRPSISSIFRQSPPLDPVKSPSSWSRGSSRSREPFNIYSPALEEDENAPFSFSSLPKSPTSARVRRREVRPRLSSQTFDHAYATQRRRKASNTPRPADVEVADVNTTKYIEHLESRLAQLQEELDSVASSAARQRQASRMKKLTEDNKDLTLELMDWREQFEARLMEESSKVRGEASEQVETLRTRIEALEMEIEVRDGKLRELEWELEVSTHKIRRAEELDETNRSLERRVDVLTELLAMSPARADFGPPSPRRDRLAPRPRSMLPRLPTAEESLSFAASIGLPSNQPILHPTMGEFTGEALDFQSDDNALTDDERRLSDHAFDDTLSRSSTLFTNSQRSSMLSTGPLSPNAFQLRPPPHVEDKMKTPSRSRCMRKFPAGSQQLKSLILPTAATCNMTIPNTAAPITSHGPLLSPEPFRSPLHGRGRSMTCAVDNYDATQSDFRSFQEAMAMERRSSSSESGSVIIGEPPPVFNDEDDSDLDIDDSILDLNDPSSESVIQTETESTIRPDTGYQSTEPAQEPESERSPSPKQTPSPYRNHNPKQDHGLIWNLRSMIYSFHFSSAFPALLPFFSRIHRMAWWMLGIFFGPMSATTASQRRSSSSNTSTSTTLRSTSGSGPVTPAPAHSHSRERTPSQKTALRSLQLWGNVVAAVFSVIGDAVRDGPESVLPLLRREIGSG